MSVADGKAVLSVRGLVKRYPTFALQDVSFELKRGRIMGFIGRNGAGKSTTLKSLLNIVRRDAGEIDFFGLPFDGNEEKIKQRVGFVSGGVDYYTEKKLKVITDVTKRFYERWDSEAYENYMTDFALDDDKTPRKLSDGMRVKYALALALSHDAEILVLDEPTSGLDPVSRDELLDVFMQIAESGRTILFSTHITSDLDKCADDITYIKNGRIIASQTMGEFVDRYALAEFNGSVDTIVSDSAVGHRRTKNGVSLLFESETADRLGIKTRRVDLEEIMVHIEKEEAK